MGITSLRYTYKTTLSMLFIPSQLKIGTLLTLMKVFLIFSMSG
jgi:hypothetical protein